MKIAIIGSRNLEVSDLGKYVPEGTDETVSGGAIGIDTCAHNFAKKEGLKLTEFFPNYKKYGRTAPLKRNDLITEYADIVIAFWDGKSKGTKYVIETCRKKNKKILIYTPKNNH